MLDYLLSTLFVKTKTLDISLILYIYNFITFTKYIHVNICSSASLNIFGFSFSTYKWDCWKSFIKQRHRLYNTPCKINITIFFTGSNRLHGYSHYSTGKTTILIRLRYTNLFLYLFTKRLKKFCFSLLLFTSTVLFSSWEKVNGRM